MPPKAKANAKPKAVKTTTSVGDLSKMQSSNKLNNKDNYSIFILNVETDSAQSILKTFIAKAKDRERRVVVPLVIQDEIVEEISLEKAQEKISNVEVGIGEIFEKTVIKKSPDEMFEEAKIEIAKCLKDDEALNEQLFALKTADLLEIWQKGASGEVKKGRASSIKATGKSEKPSAAKGDKGKKDAKGRKSDAKSMKSENIGGDGCRLGAIPRIELESRNASKFNPENKDNKIRIKYIEDHPEPGPGLYIIIIGTFNADFCLGFIREKYPLSGFISICPQDENADQPFESVCNELERFDETKPIALKNIVFPNLTKCNAEDRKQDIYDQISWLLYDAERAKRQHAYYLSQLKEIDVEMKEQFPRKSKMKFLSASSFPDKSLDSVITPIYLDNLLDTVVDIIDEQSRRQSSDEVGINLGKVPLYLEEHKVQIIHHRNEILKCMIADEGLDNLTYNRCVEIVNKYSIARKIWNACRNNDRNSSNTLDTIHTIISNLGSAITLEMPYDDKIYLELITKHATAQRLNELYDNYDAYMAQYCNARNEVNVSFSNTHEQYFEVPESNWIPTKVCFRDYYKYVADKIEEWTKEQEIINEVKIISEERRRKSMKPILDEDFIFNPSLKRTAKETAPLEIIHSQEGDIKSAKAILEITPTSLETKAEEYQPKIKIPLIAYNIGDTYYEIKTSRIKFRTASGSVKIVEDKFTSGDLQLAIDLDYFGNHVLYNHTKPSTADPPFVKLILSNSSAINFHVIYPFDNPSEDLFQTEAESGIVAYFEMQIFWPTGLQINVTNDRRTGELIAVTQIPPKGNEIKRVYFPNGIVAIYYNDGLIDVLTACGTSYEGVMRDTSMSNVHHIYGGDYIEEDGVLLQKQPKWYYTMRQFEKLNFQIQKKSYKFDTCDGYSFEVVSGQLALENKNKYVKEWWDYAAGECYAAVEGGIKTRLHGNIYEVYYPNKTLITTFTEDFVLDDNPLEEGENADIIDTEEEEEDQNENDIIDTSAMKIAGKLLEKILENTGRDRYITYNRTYLIQSENYAAIHFDKNQTKISLQDETNIVFQNNTLQINIKNEFVVNCDAERCTISGCKYRDQNNFIKAFINLIPGKEPLMEVESGIDAVLKISQNGRRTYISKAGHCHPKCIIPQDVNFILDKYFSGYELFDSSDVINLMTCERHPSCITASSDDIETLLQPLQTYQQKCKLEIPGIKQFLGKFVNEGPPCEPVWKTSSAENQELPNLMSIRSFLSASYYLNQQDLSTMVQINKRLSSLEDYICIDDSESIFRFLKYQAAVAIKKHLAEIDAKLEKRRKLKQTHDFHSKFAISRDRQRRMEIYKQTLRTKFFPKYEDFKRVDYCVKIMDFDRYKPIINKLEGRNSTSSLDITEKFLQMQSSQSNETTDCFIESTSQAL